MEVKDHLRLHAFHSAQSAKHATLGDHPALPLHERDYHKERSMYHFNLAQRHAEAANAMGAGFKPKRQGPEPHPKGYLHAGRLPQTSSKHPSA